MPAHMNSEIAGFRPFQLLRGIGVRQVRLTCGIILFAYLLSHYLNHALGNISLAAMEYGLDIHMAFWLSPIGTLLLYPALAIHASLGLWSLYQRRHFRWKAAEIVQLVLGLSIPVLLCTHLIGERLGVTLYGLYRTYALALFNFWVARPDLGVMQAVLVLVAWIHGCIGLYFWLRLKRSFPHFAPLLLGLAVLIPALALLGYYQQGRNVRLLAQASQWRAQILTPRLHRHRRRARDARTHQKLIPRFLRRGARLCLCRARRSRAQRAAAWHDQARLPGPHHPRAKGAVGA